MGIVDLVLTNLPAPGDDVPLRISWTFPRTRNRRGSCRPRHMDAQGGSVGRELQDVALEIEESVQEFGNHMRFADMRSTHSGFRMALSVPLGIVEEVLHLRPKGALDVMFEYRDRKANRLKRSKECPHLVERSCISTRRRGGSVQLDTGI